MDKFYYYKYLKYDEGSLSILSPGTLLFSNPSTFNDPFDCKPYFDEKEASNLAKHRPQLFKKVAQSLGLSPAKRLQNKGKLNANFKNYVISGKYWEDMSKHYGINSLSRNALNILMWSHYADEHKGFVVEFEWGSISDDLIPMEVQYKKTRPKINPCTHFNDGELLSYQNLLLAKSELWIYESEERLIEWRRGPGIYPYNRNKILKSVILGVSMDKKHETNIRNIIQGVNDTEKINIGVYQAEESKTGFELIVKGHPRELRAIDRSGRKPRKL